MRCTHKTVQNLVTPFFFLSLYITYFFFSLGVRFHGRSPAVMSVLRGEGGPRSFRSSILPAMNHGSERPNAHNIIDGECAADDDAAAKNILIIILYFLYYYCYYYCSVALRIPGKKNTNDFSSPVKKHKNIFLIYTW